MKTIGFGLMIVAFAIGSAAQGCAKAADSGGSSDGEGGFGGSAAQGPGATTSGAGGSSSTETTSSTTASSSTTSGSSSSSTSASTGTGMGCPAGQHLCGGVCAGNTPQTGCFGSSNCAPCMAAPVNSTSICTDNGTCDFTCGGGYVKNGNACVCGTAVCCADSDCGGNGSTCVGGNCTVPATCDGFQCATSCLAYCLFTKGTPGLGACLFGNCNCICG